MHVFAPRIEVATPRAESLQYLPLPFSSNAQEDDNVSSNVQSPLLLMLHQSCHLHHSDQDIDQLSVQNVPAGDDHDVVGTVSSSEGPRRQCFCNAQNSDGQTSSLGLSITYRDVGDYDQVLDDSLNNGSGVYVFTVEVQISHWMDRYAPQMILIQGAYVDPKPKIVEALIQVFDEVNGLVKLFRIGMLDVIVYDNGPRSKKVSA
ncbi:hypothetical protein Tco_0825178 [Tanacetum coccineum]